MRDSSSHPVGGIVVVWLTPGLQKINTAFHHDILWYHAVNGHVYFWLKKKPTIFWKTVNNCLNLALFFTAICYRFGKVLELLRNKNVDDDKKLQRRKRERERERKLSRDLIFICTNCVTNSANFFPLLKEPLEKDMQTQSLICCNYTSRPPFIFCVTATGKKVTFSFYPLSIWMSQLSKQRSTAVSYQK